LKQAERVEVPQACRSILDSHPDSRYGSAKPDRMPLGGAIIGWPRPGVRDGAVIMLALMFTASPVPCWMMKNSGTSAARTQEVKRGS
jgi:hypothetical protein